MKSVRFQRYESNYNAHLHEHLYCTSPNITRKDYIAACLSLPTFARGPCSFAHAMFLPPQRDFYLFPATALFSPASRMFPSKLLPTEQIEALDELQNCEFERQHDRV
jgi:hypothetical protein